MNVPGKTKAEYAGFWLRAAALVIDSVILLGAVLILSVLIALSSPGAVQNTLILIGVLMTWLYYALMESSSRQATLGKFALGLTVTDLRGERVSFGRATGRYFARITSGLILGIGYLLAAFTERKQALHDMMAGCLVIRKKAGQGNPVSEHVPRRVWNDIEGWVSLCTECGRTSRAHSTICDHCGHRLQRSGGIADDPTMHFLPIGRSGLAIAAGYAGLFAVLAFPAPIALILGILALRDLKAHPEKRGMGRTVFALIMGGLGSAVLLFLVSALILGILR